MLRVCKNCRSTFPPCRTVPNQTYCSKKKCQNARKNAWQKQQAQKDEDYKKAKSDAQTAWKERNPDYWDNYRQNHPDYVERNRRLQKKRNLKARNKLKISDPELPMIAMKDEYPQQSNIKSGLYILYPITAKKIAKKDALIVRIDIISGG
jgi:hypothetical protein